MRQLVYLKRGTGRFRICALCERDEEIFYTRRAQATHAEALPPNISKVGHASKQGRAIQRNQDPTDDDPELLKLSRVTDGAEDRSFFSMDYVIDEEQAKLIFI